MAKHAVYSASGAERWLRCSGSIKLCASLPEGSNRESPAAAEGTEAHACLEFLLKNRMQIDKAVKTAAKKYNPDMVAHALFAVEWLEAQSVNHPGSIILCEMQVDSSPFTCDGQFGTLDAAVVREFGRLTVVDYKYGMGTIVEPADDSGDCNPQLAYYALGLSHQYHHNFSEVELVVIQPRAWHESGDTVRSAVFSMEHMLTWNDKFKAGVAATKAKNPPLAAGTWCKYCPAAVVCPEVKEKAFAQAQIVFSDAGGIESVPEVTMLTLPHLGTILDACDKLDVWIAKVREFAETTLERGGDVPGYKLVQKRGQRKWVDEERIAKEAKAKFGGDAFTDPKLLSPAQLEKAVKGSDDWVSARVKTESSGTALAKADDKRPAVATMEQIFGAPNAKVRRLQG